jgi:hypothetical protein
MNVTTAIDGLYEAFRTVPRPRSIHACPCCFFPVEEAALLAPVALRELPVDAVKPYATFALMTVGEAADYRYFLPRLFEIVAVGDGFGYPDLVSVMRGLNHGKWWTWADEERRAVGDLLLVMWAETLEGSFYGIGDVLCGIGSVEDDVTPYLAQWTLALERIDPVVALLEFLLDEVIHDKPEIELKSAFWENRGEQAAQVVEWLCGADLRSALETERSRAEREERDKMVYVLGLGLDLLPR